MATLFAQHALLPDGWARDVSIDVAEGRIERVLPNSDRDAEAERVGIALPGLCNAHSHAFQRAMLGRTEYRSGRSTDTFWTWRQLMYQVAAQVGPEELSAIARQAYTEMLCSGYTSVVEFHYLHRVSARHGETDMRAALFDAADASGIRLTYLPVFYEQADFERQPLSQAQQRFSLPLDAYLEHVMESSRVGDARKKVGYAAHSLRAVSPESLDVIADAARRAKRPIHLHIAEQEQEVEGAKKAFGQRPVSWLLDHTVVDERWTLVHATHMDEDETASLASTGAVVCVCPSTEGNLGDGFFPLERYLRAGGRLAIGSDSHVCIDPFEELRWLEYGQRLLSQKRNVAAVHASHTGAALFAAALQGGALSAGRADVGLAVGNDADMVCLDPEAPLYVGLEDDAILDALVFGGLPSPIRGVMVAGEWRVRDGQHASAGEAAADYGDAIARLSAGE